MSRRGGRGVVQASDSCMGSRPSLLKTHSSFSHLRRACPTFPTPRLTCDSFALVFGVTFLSLSLPLSRSRYYSFDCRPRSWLRVSQLSLSTRSFKLVLYPLTTTELLLFQIGFFAKHCRTCLGRQKKKNEELASQILGKNRRASAPGPGAAGKAKNATPGSLASRIGVTKVTSLGSILVPSTVAKKKNGCSDWFCFAV